MITEETQSKFNTLVEKLNSVKEEYKVETSKLLHELVQEYLQSTPEYVVGLKWEQYTPYFNDGDACEFGIYFDSSDYDNILFKFPDSEEIEEYYDLPASIFTDEMEKELEKASELLKALADFIHNNKDILKDLLGNNVQVKILQGSKTAIIDEYTIHD